MPERKWTDHTDEFCPAFEEVYDEAYKKKSILKLHRNFREDNLYRVVLYLQQDDQSTSHEVQIIVKGKISFKSTILVHQFKK